MAAGIKEPRLLKTPPGSPDNPVGSRYGLRNGYRSRFGLYLPPLLEELGLAELTDDARNNHIRSIRSQGNAS
jgi:hypothetical protein